MIWVWLAYWIALVWMGAIGEKAEFIAPNFLALAGLLLGGQFLWAVLKVCWSILQ